MGRAVLLSGASIAGAGACLFGAAGRLDWAMAWAVLAAFTGFGVASFLLIDASLMRERAAPGPGVDRTDVLLSGLGVLALYPGLLLVAGLDAGRFAWSPGLPTWLRGLAFGVFVLGYAFALWAMHVNPFFATFVRIQDDRGHRVVRGGPYKWVRHPGYAGMLLAHLALPFALGSLWSLVPALAGTLLFAARAAHEERTLAEHLPGYREYRAQIRWRLLPLVW